MSTQSFKQLLKGIVPDHLLYNYYKRRRQHHLVPYGELFFEVHLAEHCNLNCAGCNHFSPLAEPEFTDPATLDKDFARLASLFGEKMSHINLLGGEPLLHPSLNECMQIARRHFPKTRITLVTNGLLLTRQKDEFWQTCRENQITIQVTRYPIKLDFDQMLENSSRKLG